MKMPEKFWNHTFRFKNEGEALVSQRELVSLGYTKWKGFTSDSLDSIRGYPYFTVSQTGDLSTSKNITPMGTYAVTTGEEVMEYIRNIHNTNNNIMTNNKTVETYSTRVTRESDGVVFTETTANGMNLSDIRDTVKRYNSLLKEHAKLFPIKFANASKVKKAVVKKEVKEVKKSK